MHEAPMYHLIAPTIIRRLASVLEEGRSHGDFKWMEGISAYIHWNRALDHLMKFVEGDVTEDHLGHALCRIGFLVHYSEIQPNLFDGMPPGCKAGMLKFLALCHAAREAPEQAEVGPRNPGNTTVKSEFLNYINLPDISKQPLRTPAMIAHWIEEAQQSAEHNGAARDFDRGWDAAFEHLIEKILQKTP